MTQRGVFITIEGTDGCGKTTQAALLNEALRARGFEVVCLREPGGTPISEQIRELVLDPAHREMSDACELLLYEASRAQLVQEVIQPALERGAVVLCDRYADSTFAYQAAGRGLDEMTVQLANKLGTCGCLPDRTLVLDTGVDSAYARATTGVVDRLEAEGLAFQKQVYAGYRQLAEAEPARVRFIDASGNPDEVFARLWQNLSEFFASGQMGERVNMAKEQA